MTDPRPTSYPGVTLRPSEKHDLDFLYGVYAASRAAEMALLTDWSEAQKEAFLRAQFQAQQTHYHSHYPGARFDVIVADGADVGRLYVAPMSGELRLMDIALLPQHRNRGIGRALVQDVLDEASRQGLRVSLHVEAENPAKRLYARLDFVEVGEDSIYKRMEWVPPTLRLEVSG